MKKKLIIISLMTALMLSAGCTPNYQTDEKDAPKINSEDSGKAIIVTPSDTEPLGDIRIERKEASDLTVPEGYISLDDAVELLYKCNREYMYLPENANTYKAYCTGIADYENSDYYSIYLYLDAGDERITVGTAYLVSCDGKTVRKKTWTGEFTSLKLDGSASDKDLSVRFPDAKITPNEALKMIAERKPLLKLEFPLADYVFEMNENLYEADGAMCYNFTPKIEYTDHINLLGGFFVNIDGSAVYYSLPDTDGHYIEVK